MSLSVCPRPSAAVNAIFAAATVEFPVSSAAAVELQMAAVATSTAQRPPSDCMHLRPGDDAFDTPLLGMIV